MNIPPGIVIKENSFIAKIAACRLKSSNVAIVFGKQIHLYGVSRQAFLSNAIWVKHELKHVEQYQRSGTVMFLIRYLIECIRHGYYNNHFEKEARQAEGA